MAIELRRWHWWARRATERAGPAGVAAAVLAVATLAAWAIPVVAISAQARTLSLDIASLQGRAHAPVQAASGPALTSEGQLAAFESRFPDRRALGASYVRLWNLARRHGVALRQAEFKLADGGEDALQRYAIVVPVTADYASLRAFIGDALADLPGLALEEVSLRRADAKSLQLDARLRFVLFARRGAV
jgi:hypothetical protein